MVGSKKFSQSQKTGKSRKIRSAAKRREEKGEKNARNGGGWRLRSFGNEEDGGEMADGKEFGRISGCLRLKLCRIRKIFGSSSEAACNSLRSLLREKLEGKKERERESRPSILYRS